MIFDSGVGHATFDDWLNVSYRIILYFFIRYRSLNFVDLRLFLFSNCFHIALMSNLSTFELLYIEIYFGLFLLYFFPYLLLL